MERDARSTLTAYFESWRANDLDRYQAVLADDVTFKGPLGEVQGAEACRQAIENLAKITTGIEVQKMIVDGGDVLTWFELQTSVAPAMPVANWAQVTNGQITRIRVTFDPREMLAGG
jgi:ketosteroid isomerase-like protein